MAPLGQRTFIWPPYAHCLSGVHFVAYAIDGSERMTEAESCVREAFPTDKTLTVVMPVPGNRVGYHIAATGSAWPVDPALRAKCHEGGFLVGEDGSAEHLEVSFGA